jgi:hypothetical protein
VSFVISDSKEKRLIKSAKAYQKHGSHSKARQRIKSAKANANASDTLDSSVLDKV